MISVCIPTYNGEKYIKEQLESILKQLSEDDEIIISDDQSTDNTLQVITSLNDDRIKVYVHEKKITKYSGIERNINLVSSNLQNALKKSRGDVIYLADQDDIWLDDRVSDTFDFFHNAGSDKILVVCNCTVIDRDKNTLMSYFDNIKVTDSLLSVIYKNPYLGCCMCFNRQLLDSLFPFPKQTVGHDLWIGLIGKLTGEVHFINKPLVLYRRHGNTVTTSGATSRNSLKFKVKYRLGIFYALLVRIFSN